VRWAWLTLLLLLLARVAWPVALREISPQLAVAAQSEHHRFAPQAQRPSHPFHASPPTDPAGEPPRSLDPWGHPFGCTQWPLANCHVVSRYYSFGPDQQDDFGGHDDLWVGSHSFDLGLVVLAYLPDALLVGAVSLAWCMGCWWLGRGQRRTTLLLPLVPSLAAWTLLDGIVSARTSLSWWLVEPTLRLEQAPRTAALSLAFLLAALGWIRSRHPRPGCVNEGDSCV